MPTFAFSGKVVGVPDGDTITVMHQGKREEVRLYGIDCPEKGQAFGQKAKRFTSDMVFGKVVEVEPLAAREANAAVGVEEDQSPMNKSLRELEAKIRKLCTSNHICDPQDLVSFTLTNNLELEIEKKDGSRVRILKRLIGRCEKDPVAKVELLGKLRRGFRKAKRG